MGTVTHGSLVAVYDRHSGKQAGSTLLAVHMSQSQCFPDQFPPGSNNTLRSAIWVFVSLEALGWGEGGRCVLWDTVQLSQTMGLKSSVESLTHKWDLQLNATYVSVRHTTLYVMSICIFWLSNIKMDILGDNDWLWREDKRQNWSPVLGWPSVPICPSLSGFGAESLASQQRSQFTANGMAGYPLKIPSSIFNMATLKHLIQTITWFTPLKGRTKTFVMACKAYTVCLHTSPTTSHFSSWLTLLQPRRPQDLWWLTLPWGPTWPPT